MNPIYFALIIFLFIGCKKELEDESHTKLLTAETRILGTWELEKVEGDDGVDYTYLFKNDTAENFIYWQFIRKKATFASKNDVDFFYFKVKSNYGDKFVYPKYKVPGYTFVPGRINIDSKGNKYFFYESWRINEFGVICFIGSGCDEGIAIDSMASGPFMSNYNFLERFDKMAHQRAVKATKITKHKLYLTITKDNVEEPRGVKTLYVIFKN